MAKYYIEVGLDSVTKYKEHIFIKIRNGEKIFSFLRSKDSIDITPEKNLRVLFSDMNKQVKILRKGKVKKGPTPNDLKEQFNLEFKEYVDPVKELKKYRDENDWMLYNLEERRKRLKKLLAGLNDKTEIHDLLSRISSLNAIKEFINSGQIMAKKHFIMGEKQVTQPRQDTFRRKRARAFLRG